MKCTACGGEVVKTVKDLRSKPWTATVETCSLCQRRTVDGKVVNPGKIARPATPEIKR